MSAPSTRPVLDHVAHWVPDLDAAAEVFARLGFTLTPWSEQRSPTTPGAEPVSAGTANRCIMLEEGYIEVLTPIGDTPVARELRAAMERYVGLHLVAFGSPDAAAEHGRLEKAGFPQRPLVALSRTCEGPDGETRTLRFTVARPEPGTMAEGRIQFVTHHTPDLLWQKRYLEHPNGARALTAVVIVTADPTEAARRFGRYAGVPAEPIAGGYVLATARGTVEIRSEDRLDAVFPDVAVPALPFVAGYRIAVAARERTAEFLRGSGWSCSDLPGGLSVALPGACGGGIFFQ